MNYLVVGINHKTVPVEGRERLAVSADRLPDVLKTLQARDPQTLTESAMVSTCNRIEIYGAVSDIDRGREILSQYFSDSLGTNTDNGIYIKQDVHAIEHLFRVAASLDSMVVGENQILSQIKESYRIAADSSATGPLLNRLFNRALFVAKRIKSETEISKGNISVGSVGVALAKKIFGSLSQKNILLLGAGEIGALVAKHLGEATDAGLVKIVNRSPQKSLELEAQGYGQALAFESFESELIESDILITSISGEIPALSPEAMSLLMAKRYQRPLFIIDLGVPRNVDAQVGEIENIYLYDVDDLAGVAEENKDLRHEAVGLAQNIIDEETRQFYESHLSLAAVPAIARLNRKFEDIRALEVQKTLSKMSHLSERDIAQLEQMTRTIVARILHDPILQLKTGSVKDSKIVSVVKKLFSLEEEGDQEHEQS